jgi:hypothetical protein
MFLSRPQMNVVLILAVLIACAPFLPLFYLPFINESLHTNLTASSYLGTLGTGLFFAEVAIVALVGIVLLRAVRNRRALKSHRLLRFELDAEMTLRRYERAVQYRGIRRPLVAAETMVGTIALPKAEFASWLASPIFTSSLEELVELWEGERRVGFWDRDPKMQLEPFGPAPTNLEAVQLGEISLDDLAESPDTRRAVLDYLAARARVGSFSANVELETGSVKGSSPR